MLARELEDIGRNGDSQEMLLRPSPTSLERQRLRPIPLGVRIPQRGQERLANWALRSRAPVRGRRRAPAPLRPRSGCVGGSRPRRTHPGGAVDVSPPRRHAILRSRSETVDECEKHSPSRMSAVVVQSCPSFVSPPAAPHVRRGESSPTSADSRGSAGRFS